MKKLYNKSSVESADINNNISDRKDIPLSESADIPSKETLKKDLLGFVSSIFKKKNEESELEENEIISFWVVAIFQLKQIPCNLFYRVLLCVQKIRKDKKLW